MDEGGGGYHRDAAVVLQTMRPPPPRNHCYSARLSQLGGTLQCCELRSFKCTESERGRRWRWQRAQGEFDVLRFELNGGFER